MKEHPDNHYNIKKLIETQQRYRALMDNTMLGIAIMDTSHRILSVNKTFSDLLNKKEADLISRYCFNEFEKRDVICPHCPAMQALATGKTCEVFIQGVLDNDEKYYAWIRTFPFYGQDGKINGFIEIIEDVTKQKTAEEKLKNAYEELKEIQAHLIQSEKMAAIGQLAAGIAHEINNPTAYILSNLEVLVEDIKTLFQTIGNIETLVKGYFLNDKEDHDKFYKEFDRIVGDDELKFLAEDLPVLLVQSIEGAKKIKTIVNNLKSFAHPGHEGITQIDVNVLINKTLDLVHNEVKYKCEVIKDLREVPAISANEHQLEQVFINIIINASQAIENNGVIHINTFSEEASVIIEIIDNGTGIAEENIGKIFDPFFTTKTIGEGTGLGLAIVYGIVKDNKGEIEVESIVSEGTKFKLSFPFVKQ